MTWLLLCATFGQFDLIGSQSEWDLIGTRAQQVSASPKAKWQSFRASAVAQDGNRVVIAVGQSAKTESDWRDICTRNGWKFYPTAADDWKDLDVGVHEYISRNGELYPATSTVPATVAMDTAPVVRSSEYYTPPVTYYTAAPVQQEIPWQQSPFFAPSGPAQSWGGYSGGFIAGGQEYCAPGST